MQKSEMADQREEENLEGVFWNEYGYSDLAQKLQRDYDAVQGEK